MAKVCKSKMAGLKLGDLVTHTHAAHATVWKTWIHLPHAKCGAPFKEGPFFFKAEKSRPQSLQPHGWIAFRVVDVEPGTQLSLF